MQIKVKPAAPGNGLFCNVSPHNWGDLHLVWRENDAFIGMKETIKSCVGIRREKTRFNVGHQREIGGIGGKGSMKKPPKALKFIEIDRERTVQPP